MVLAIVGSLLAATCNALSSVLERLATSKQFGRQLLSRRQAWANFTSRLFVVGIVLQIAGFAAQAMALSKAPLIVVEPLLTTDLIFLLLIIHFPLKVKVKARDWWAVAFMCVGMSGLFLAANPRSGHLRYSLLPWLLTVCLAASLAAAGLLVVKTATSPQRRAAAAALAAALSFALNAAFTKLALNQWQQQGLGTVFSSWPLYALIVSGITSLYLMQTAYSTGPLAVSQPIMEVTEPTISVLIGMLIFGDSVSHSPAALAAELASISLVMFGIIRLASSPQIQQAGERGI